VRRRLRHLVGKVLDESKVRGEAQALEPACRLLADKSRAEEGRVFSRDDNPNVDLFTPRRIRNVADERIQIGVHLSP
jgi:hypothetical protein